MYYTLMQTPFGPFALAGTELGIRQADFQDSDRPLPIRQEWTRSDRPFKPALTALERYFSGKPERFTLQYDLQGTAFRLAVWQALGTIAPGQTLSYKAMAELLNMPNGSRAVGSAVGKNPLTLLIPCHRVVGSNGKLTGFAGGLALKEQLLRHEGWLE